jgi:hypothetical protein
VGLTDIVLYSLVVGLARPGKSCKDGWTRAGKVRRAITRSWAVKYMLDNGPLIGEPEPLITRRDLFPDGIDAEKVANVENGAGSWLDYWSAKYPEDTLERAMLNLLARLAKFKLDSGWGADGQIARINDAIEHVQGAEFETSMRGLKV